MVRDRDFKSPDRSGKKRLYSEIDDEEKARRERDAIRAQRRRDIIREDRLERAGHRKTKNERDGERDISEKIALGQAQPSSKEAMFDQRLFNQTTGLSSGFGHDADYNLYDKPLFADRTAASIYKNVKNIDINDYTEDDQSKTDVKKALESKQASRSKPVEFEKRRLEEAADDANFKAGL